MAIQTSCFFRCHDQAPRDVTTLFGSRGKKQVWYPPMFAPEVSRKKIYCIEKVLLTLLRLFGAPRSHSVTLAVIVAPP